MKGTITLASDLAQKEAELQDYVIVHELLHLRVPNHGRLFKVLMAAYVPRWRSLASRLSDSVSNRRECQR
jgi:predicted metal-dependent hydrolase